MSVQNKKQRFIDKLKDKYRLVILNDDTFEERASFRLSRFNVYVILSTLVLILVVLIFSAIIFTPLKEYIPGYGDISLRQDFMLQKLRSDSLETIMARRNAWTLNLRNVLTGRIDTSGHQVVDDDIFYDTIRLDRIPIEDALLREEIEREENYALIFSREDQDDPMSLSNLNLFPPIKGYVTSQFDANSDHFGIDIVAQENEPIKAVLEGTVILASWTLETGYIIGIQHSYNLVSFYKHNSVLLKKVGNFVKAGDAIAIIGSSGELTSGPHLHFELWQNSTPVDPEGYINF